MEPRQFAIHLVESIKQIEDYSSAGEVDSKVTTQALHSAQPYYRPARHELFSLIVDRVD